MYVYNCKVDRIIDGDTVDLFIDLGFNVVLHERIRLYGINAPEVRTKDLEEKERGLQAKAYLYNWLDSNPIQVETVKGRGKYDRWLGTLYAIRDDGLRININEQMILDGHAVEYRG